MRGWWKPCLVPVLLSALAACGGRSAMGPGDGSGSDVSGSAPIQTDRASYTARRQTMHLVDGTRYENYLELTIGLRYTNPTDEPIYLVTCLDVNPPVLEKKEGAEWVTAFAPIVPECLGPPVVIGRGESYEYIYRIEAFLPGSRVMPQFQTEVPGTYRLVWTAYRTWLANSVEAGLGRELPLEQRVSNEFSIVEESRSG